MVLYLWFVTSVLAEVQNTFCNQPRIAYPAYYCPDTQIIVILLMFMENDEK